MRVAHSYVAAERYIIARLAYRVLPAVAKYSGPLTYELNSFPQGWS
jgi:hypothetical protein